MIPLLNDFVLSQSSILGERSHGHPRSLRFAIKDGICFKATDISANLHNKVTKCQAPRLLSCMPTEGSLTCSSLCCKSA